MSNINGNSVLLNNINRTNELDRRILARNAPSDILELSVGPRPQATKYTLLPIFGNKQCINKQEYLPYDITKTFNPGNTQSPWTGFSVKVNDESILRNQIYANQRYCQAAYIPGSNSDLYNSSITNIHNNSNTNNAVKQFPGLFENPVLNNNQSQYKNVENLGNNLFNNYTRQQLKNT
jgi:hypothetical protein